MLDQNIKNQLHSHFSVIKRPIELVIALDDSSKSIELKELAEDISSLSDFISVRENQEPNVRKPSLAVYSPTHNTQMTFAGVPMGHEFTSLVLAVLQTGGHPPKATEDEIEQIIAIDTPLKFEIYISLSCQTCPQVVQALNVMAGINSNIDVTMIDGALFQDEVKSRNILAVPSVYLNGELFSQGAITLTDILNKLDNGAQEKQVSKLNDKEAFDVLVVGGGPAGASAAIYAARKGLNTGVVADRFGGQVADTLSIENFIATPMTEGSKLVAQLEEHVNQYTVDVMKGQRAAHLSRGNLINIELESGAQLKTKSLVIATGARWRNMNVPGEAEYKGKGVAYCPHCDGPLFKGKSVAVIGGGNSGIEAAIDLANIVEHVTVLEFANQLKADEVLVKKVNSLNNVTILKGVETTEVLGNGSNVTGLVYRDRSSQQEHKIMLAGIFVQIGLVPNSEWLEGTDIVLSPNGEIVTDESGATSMSGVFAAGDVTNTPYKQIIISMGSGATASLGAFDYLIRHQDSSSQAA